MKATGHRREVWIVGIALALLVFTVIRARFDRPLARSGPAAEPVSAPVIPEPAPNPTAGASLDADRLEEIARKWLNGSGSDLFGVPPPEPVPDPFASLDQFHVSAIWREPGRQFAIINRRILRVGDSIQGFRLDHCDRDAVWLGGPTGSRRLPMSRLRPASSGLEFNLSSSP